MEELSLSRVNVKFEKKGINENEWKFFQALKRFCFFRKKSFSSD